MENVYELVPINQSSQRFAAIVYLNDMLTNFFPSFNATPGTPPRRFLHNYATSDHALLANGYRALFTYEPEFYNVSTKIGWQVYNVADLNKIKNATDIAPLFDRSVLLSVYFLNRDDASEKRQIIGRATSIKSIAICAFGSESIAVAWSVSDSNTPYRIFVRYINGQGDSGRNIISINSFDQNVALAALNSPSTFHSIYICPLKTNEIY